MATVRPSKRIFMMEGFLAFWTEWGTGAKNSGDIGIELPHFSLVAQRFPDGFQGWVARATKRGCIATCKRALRKFLRERRICFFKSPRLSIQKILPKGGRARRGKNSPLRQNPRCFFSTRITSGDGGKLFGRIGELFGQKSKIT